MPLNPVTKGDPHIAAHNAERAAINGLENLTNTSFRNGVKTASREVVETFGVTPTIKWNKATASWPVKASSIPSGYTGPVIWSSMDDIAASPPSEDVDGDYWDKRVS